MLARLIPVALPLLLGACDMKVGKDASRDNISTVSVGDEGNVAIAATEEPQGMTVSVPGFQAKVNIPGLELDSEHMDIDGLKLYPGTKVTAVNVNSREGAGVMMHFTSPGTPAQLAQYYADSARQHNFTDVSVRSDTARSTLAATKPDGDRLTIALAPAANGSSGQITVIDSK